MEVILRLNWYSLRISQLPPQKLFSTSYFSSFPYQFDYVSCNLTHSKGASYFYTHKSINITMMINMRHILCRGIKPEEDIQMSHQCLKILNYMGFC